MASTQKIHNKMEVINLDKIKADMGFNAREKLDNVKELASDMKKNGLMQPVVVKKTGKNGAYALIAGFRRHAAALELGWVDIPATIIEPKEEQDEYLANLTENVSRQNLTGYELAFAVKHVKDSYGLSGAQIAARLSGMSRGYVNNLLRIVDCVMAEILDQWHDGHPCATTDFLRDPLAKMVDANQGPDEEKQYQKWVQQCKGKGEKPGFGDGKSHSAEVPDADKVDSGSGKTGARTPDANKIKKASTGVMQMLFEALEAADDEGELDNTEPGSLAKAVVRFSQGNVKKVQVSGFYFEPEAAKKAEKEAEKEAKNAS